MGRLIPKTPPFPKDWSDKQKYEAVIKILDDHKLEVQKDFDTCMSFIIVLTWILAVCLIAYLIKHSTL